MKELLVYKKLVEKLIIIGENHNMEKAVNQYKSQGYRIIHTGARPLGFRQYSKREFKIVAEKVLD